MNQKVAPITSQPSDAPRWSNPLYDVPLLNPQKLANLSVSDTTGFPIFNLSIFSPALGWSSIYGAIQVFTASPHLPQSLSSADWKHDDHPIFDGVNAPFYDFAPNPRFFDYPFANKEDWDWTARMFVVYVPDALISKHVKPILGVEWGFWVEGGEKFVKGIKNLDVRVWNEHLELLRGGFEGWRFDEA
ncbi:MAG: hypothetical protein M1821_008385 [Bathelium mastoideum]|nr:MAG: hypothetical protein M1821_008385 [Bathelium mastoideum]